tara:strand:+ start:1656 stop:2984 length:1329 start_codon:yes stop_codon:yes gene_type:complete
MLDLSYRSILKMAIPLMASTFIQSVVLITDSFFLSRYDIIAFDAAGNGGLVYITLIMLLVGMSDGSQILMARRIGEGKQNFLARIFGTTLLNNFAITIILFLSIFLFIPDLISSYSKSIEVGQGQIDYIQVRSFGLIFSFISLAINAYFMAIGKTKLVFINAIFIAVSNIGLDYLLINGNSGFPELGLKGAALASSIADAIGMLFLIAALYLSKEQRAHSILKKITINKESFQQLFKISSPIMLSGLIALSTWTIFFAWIEQIGTHELTISQNIRSLYFLAFVPIWGFGATTKTYISQYLGNKDLHSIPIIIRKVQTLTTLSLIFFFHGAILYPDFMIKLVNPNQVYVSESVEILRFVFGSVIIYGVSSVYFQAINGSGNTRHNFYIEFISVLMYILSAYLLIKAYKVELFWVWIVEYIYFSTLGVLSYIYIRYYPWQKKEI